AAAAEHLARREAELGAQLSEIIAVRDTLERALTEEQSAHQHASAQAAADLAAAAERQAALDDLLAQQGDRARSLEQQLAAAETARLEADHRHLAELAAAASDLDTLRARYDAAVTEHAAARAAFEQQLIDGAAARQQADQRAAAAVAAATARETEAVERLTAESEARAALERDLAGIRMESARGRRRSLQIVSAFRRRSREQTLRLEAQLSGERTDADRRLRAKDEEVRQIHEEHERVQGLLGTTEEQLRRVHRTVDEERQAYARARLTSESELQRVAAEYGQLRQAFDQLQGAFQALEQVAAEHAAERARLGSVVAERDDQLRAQAERHVHAEQVANDALAQLQESLRQTLETSGSDIARLQREIDVLRRELDATRTDAEALRGVAVRVPDLQAQLELSEKERRRQFERAPYGLCRCTQDGVITEANHAFAMLLGRRRADQLRNMDFAAAVFDRAGDVGWLLERTRTMRKAEPVETCWKTQDGRDLIVRLQALATTTGSVEIVVEDITGVRALEDRLRQAQRMEAVGRLASEVAVTCDALLRDVARDAHEWLATIASDDALHRRGEMLLADLARAAGFLRQLGAYGDRQVRALEPVSVQRVLRDLAPVLKCVAGDPIELVLPKASGSFDVDVEAERLERVLVNVASFARERMPQGGQMKIDLATTSVGRRFTAKYPNIRPGPHVLITVTELPGSAEFHGGKERRSRSSYTPGVDLGALVDLIGTCGGHLWMEAQPAGNMSVKIHLPKPATFDPTGPTGPGARADRRGRLARWFRSAPAPAVRS
ncbi:MAG TPA: PAS domain-containing protein, partial [Steroidobacteraceae bacterium]